MSSVDKNKNEPPAVNQFKVSNILIARQTNKCYGMQSWEQLRLSK